MNPYLKIGMSQDQHIFAKRLGLKPLDALRNIFGDNDYTAQLDALFYCGDLFDFFLDVPATDIRITTTMEYMGWRLEQAVKHNYAVRVLKGTPSHDREQNEMWVTANNILGNKADFKYISELCIESHPIMGDILYIPDEWKPTADQVWEDVVEALRVKGISKVDWIIMHGAFKFQLPEHLHAKLDLLHEESRYTAICRKYILVGHIHVKGQYDNIISNGSLDRKNFNEEEPKGALRIDCNPNGDKLTFIENTQARIMPTLDVRNTTLDEVIDKIQDIVSVNDPSYISIRFLGNKLDQIHLNMDAISNLFPLVEFVFKDADEKAKSNPTIKLDRTDFKVSEIDLSKSVVTAKLSERIGKALTPTITEKLDDLFKDYP